MRPPLPRLRFIASPKLLPRPPKEGRVALVDLAFAHGNIYEQKTVPFIERLGPRLAAWIDHHEHVGWARFGHDPRFILVPKNRAPACPELVTPKVVKQAGPVQHLFAHADFDGCVAAAKFLLGGKAPYDTADTDARAIDAPGRGFSCSDKAKRLALAMDRARATTKMGTYCALLSDITNSLIGQQEPPELRASIDTYCQAQRERLQELHTWLDNATTPHPDVLLIRVAEKISPSDRKALLCLLEERARVAVVEAENKVTVGSFNEEGLNLGGLPGLEGSVSFGWGTATATDILPELFRQLRR